MAGNIQWFRWHHGSVTDPKFKLIAHKAKQSLATVIAVWAFLLEQASASDERGAFGDVDCESLDCLLGLEDGATSAIVLSMEGRGLVADGSVSAWEKRQPKRERVDENSTERSRAFRHKQRQETHGIVNATPQSGDETPCNATQHLETPREEKRREEKKEEKKEEAQAPSRKRDSSPPPARPEDVEPQTWGDWLVLRRAKKAPVSETVISGARAEAAKAGMPLDAFLRVWCTRGSQGLQADWLSQHERTANGGTPKVRGLVL